ncbi:MAG TPA: GAF domain-containing protein [Steroidobacteraceae bacterium]|nr:GAF domain-containing protein [Steroidobacteraceae bacterium]
MHELDIDSSQPKPALYASIAAQLRALVEGEPDLIANLANAAALLFHALPELNWAGFYLLKNGELVVGPFQGRPACVRIALGKGVCGTAAERRATVVVANVHEFSGHIACDSASNSEIVVPLLRGDELIGVLDIDSPKFGRFDAEDQAGLEEVVAELVKALSG